MRRWPALGRALGAAFDLLGATFMGLILYGSFPLFTEAFENDYYVGNEGVFTAPVWPIKALVVIGVWSVLLLFANLWLARYRIGPLEWLWRCMTYRQVFALKR